MDFASFACKLKATDYRQKKLTNSIQRNLPQDWQKGKGQFPEICFPKSK